MIRKLFLALLLTTFSFAAQALDLDTITQKEAGSGIKEALNKASVAAVGKLGSPDGFLNNPQVHIPLPDGLEKAKKAMKLLGRQKQFDDLEVSINRAAEAAIPEAKALLLSAVKNMTVQDAKGILAGGDDSVTRFFQSKTQAQLSERFLPIVKTSTDKVGLAQQYNHVAEQASSLGVLKKEDSKIENYVTRKALDGLFISLAQEEKAIRNDPISTGSALLSKIFGPAH